MLKGFTRSFRPLEILTAEKVEDVHRGVLAVLGKTGVTVHHQRALQLFEKNGCRVDYDNERVYIPPGLVEESLRKCPSSFLVKSRNRDRDLIIGGNTTYFSVAPGMQTVDLNTWEMRPATRKENYDSVTILDALENLQHLCCYSPYFGFDGVPPVMSINESVAAKMRNSDKYQHTGNANDCEVFNIAMAKAVGAEINGQLCPSSPLTFYSDVAENAFRFTEAGFPLHVTSGAMFGGTSPATIAGSLVVCLAEILASVTLIQLLKPGTRVAADNFTFPMNMTQGSPDFGSIGISLSYVAFNQIFRKYGLPIVNGAIYPSSKRIDFQCAYEKATIAWQAALSGANVIFLYGSLYGELAWHPLQAILDDDIAGMIGRFLQGLDVTDNTLALDLIDDIGPIPGHYLNTKHTRDWWRQENFVRKAADTLTYPEWSNSGKKDCVDYAKGRLEQIIATHKVSTPLTASQDEDIESILNEARDFYKKKGMISDTEWKAYLKDLKSPNYPYA